MGDAIGDILYIFVMVAALIFSIYKKSKSREHDGDFMPEHEGGDITDEAFPPFNEWFDDEDQKSPSEKQPSPEMKATPMQAEKMKAEKMKPEKLKYKKPEYKGLQNQNKLKRTERTSRISHKLSRLHSIQVEQQTDETSYWDDESFNLQKAIIYSEIIKRPTF